MAQGTIKTPAPEQAAGRKLPMWKFALGGVCLLLLATLFASGGVDLTLEIPYRRHSEGSVA